MKYLFVLILFVISNSNYLYSNILTANPKSWSTNDFLGFDDVGDSKGTTGDISSVFAKINNNKLKLRITFDNMVTRKSNNVIKDHLLLE